MPAGNSTYNDISAFVASIYEGTLFTLSNQARLLPTVRLFQDAVGFAPRVLGEYQPANVRTVADGEDVTPTQFNKTSLATVTPQRRADHYLITDARMMSDPDNVMRDASEQLGSAFADNIDADIVALFGSLTGGTVGTAGNPLTWTMISNASAILSARKANGRVFCVLHPYQFADLVTSATTTGHAIANAVNVYNELDGVYFTSGVVANTTFVVTNAIPIDASDDATGAMYVSNAIGLDMRQGFMINASRDESRYSTELNASMVYGVGAIRPLLGVKIVSDATVPA